MASLSPGFVFAVTQPPVAAMAIANVVSFNNLKFAWRMFVFSQKPISYNVRKACVDYDSHNRSSTTSRGKFTLCLFLAQHIAENIVI